MKLGQGLGFYKDIVLMNKTDFHFKYGHWQKKIKWIKIKS